MLVLRVCLYITSSQVASALQICGSYFWVAKDQLIPQGLWFYWVFESWNYEITNPTPSLLKPCGISNDFQATLKFQNPSSEHLWICGLEFLPSWVKFVSTERQHLDLIPGNLTRPCKKNLTSKTTMTIFFLWLVCSVEQHPPLLVILLAICLQMTFDTHPLTLA